MLLHTPDVNSSCCLQHSAIYICFQNMSLGCSFETACLHVHAYYMYHHYIRNTFGVHNTACNKQENDAKGPRASCSCGNRWLRHWWTAHRAQRTIALVNWTVIACWQHGISHMYGSHPSHACYRFACYCVLLAFDSLRMPQPNHQLLLVHLQSTCTTQ